MERFKEPSTWASLAATLGAAVSFTPAGAIQWTVGLLAGLCGCIGGYLRERGAPR
jgi:hypothetical protein